LAYRRAHGPALGLRPGVVKAHDSRFAAQWRRAALKADISWVKIFRLSWRDFDRDVALETGELID
jgi:hypothetical protein